MPECRRKEVLVEARDNNPESDQIEQEHDKKKNIRNKTSK
jgi:hypothetical protein